MSTIAIDELRRKFEEAKTKNLALDMTRGKPASDQLDLSLKMLDIVTSTDFKTPLGEDPRNYGGLDGLPEMKAIFKDFLETSNTNEIIVGGNSSLSLMHDTIANAMAHGVVDSKTPWSKLPVVKFICPAPGYDRHFAICQHFGIEMITTEMKADGPDMDEVEKLLASDDSIKGIWIVPKYANPSGSVCSDKVVDRLAKMKTAAKDFRIMWDNAYAVHHLSDKHSPLKDLLQACKDAGNPNRVLIYGSTSKISFAGAGVAAMGGSVENMNWMRANLSFSTIGPDKINQLRHIRFFKDINGIHTHMKKHAELIREKFAICIQILSKELGGKGVATWTNPIGGYFISLDTNEGCAKRVVQLAAEAGVKLTSAGATFPYGKDPKDTNIRLAPTLPSVSEIKQAMEIVCLCVLLADAEKN